MPKTNNKQTDKSSKSSYKQLLDCSALDDIFVDPIVWSFFMFKFLCKLESVQYNNHTTAKLKLSLQEQ